LGRRAARQQEGAFVIEGAALLAEALDAGAPIEAVFVGPGALLVDGGGEPRDRKGILKNVEWKVH